MKDKKGSKSKILGIFSKIVLSIGVILVLCKVPSMVAEKISYRQIKKKEIKQDLTEEE